MNRRHSDIPPKPSEPIERCVRCALDITDFDEVELRAHASFHRYLDEEPKSIPHQDPRPQYESSLWTMRVRGELR